MGGVMVPAISNRVSDYTTGKESNPASKKIALNDVIFKMTGPNNEDFDSYKDAKTCSDQLDAWRKESKNEKNLTVTNQSLFSSQRPIFMRPRSRPSADDFSL